MLKTFQKNNSKHGITGVLFYNDGIILQYIEGGSLNVDNLYKNSSNDTRHHNISKLIDEDITERLFPEWSMGFNMCRKLDEIEALNEFLNNIELLPKQHNILTLFKSLNLLKSDCV
jgi:hypothetical protein